MKFGVKQGTGRRKNMTRRGKKKGEGNKGGKEMGKKTEGKKK